MNLIDDRGGNHRYHLTGRCSCVVEGGGVARGRRECRGGQSTRIHEDLFGGGVATHLGVRVGREVVDYLVGCDALADGALDGGFGEFGGC